MFEYELGFPGWFFSKKPSNSFLENEIRNKLNGVKEITKVYKEGDRTITEKSYSGDGFSYVETTSEYTPNEADLKVYQLQGELEDAVKSEDFEKAATIKKEIETIKGTKTNESK